MLSSRIAKLMLATRTLNQATRLGAIRCMSGDVPAKTDKELVMELGATMNDQPVPSGSYQEGYKKRNAKYNRQLFISISLCVIVAYYMYSNNHLYTHPLPDLDEFERWRKAKKAREAEEAAAEAEGDES